ncbi:MAG: dicarboxylate/amino acid:cation symporter, partial [Methylocystis sp.]
GNLAQVGAGFAGKPDPSAIAKYTALAEKRGGVEFLLDIIPDSAIGAFAKGDILQVLLFSLLFGFALLALGERGRALRVIIDDVGHAMFGVIAIIMKAAPIGAFGAMAYTVAKYGSAALLSLAGLVGLFYLTAGLFVVFVLGAIARAAGFNIFSLIAYLRDELLIVLGTSSSESALPALMEKLQWLGCSKSVVGLVVPTGYSFNLDGTNIYMTLTTLFIARAMGVELDLSHQATILIVAMLTSKGASGVSGAGFITLAATLTAVDPQLAPGMSLVLGVDKFMSECRALTNFIGNGVAAIVVAAWEGELDRARLTAGLARKIDPSDVAIGVTTE